MMKLSTFNEWYVVKGIISGYSDRAGYSDKITSLRCVAN